MFAPRSTTPESDEGQQPATGPGDDSGSSSGGASSPASIDLSRRKTGVTVARKVISAGLLAVSGLLNERFALDEGDPTWLMDGDQVDEIAGPLARVAIRRIPMVPEDGSDTNASDVMDVVTAVVSVAGYVLGNLRQRAAIRREMRLAMTGDVPQGDHGRPADEAPAPAPAAPVPGVQWAGPVVPGLAG